MIRDLQRLSFLWSWKAWTLGFTFTTHGAERADRAGYDRYVRIGPVVIGIPHGWRRVESLKELALDNARLRAELEMQSFKFTGKFGA